MNEAVWNDIMGLGDLPLLGDLLTLGDVLFAALIAVPLVWLVRVFARFVRFGFGRSFRLKAQPEELVMLLESCRKIFPIESILYRGRTFSRGMIVKITLERNESFVGELVGMNEDNVVCVVSREVVAADRLDNLVDMAVVAEASAPDEGISEDVQSENVQSNDEIQK